LYDDSVAMTHIILIEQPISGRDRAQLRRPIIDGPEDQVSKGLKTKHGNIQ